MAEFSNSDPITFIFIYLADACTEVCISNCLGMYSCSALGQCLFGYMQCSRGHHFYSRNSFIPRIASFV